MSLVNYYSLFVIFEKAAKYELVVHSLEQNKDNRGKNNL